MMSRFNPWFGLPNCWPAVISSRHEASVSYSRNDAQLSRPRAIVLTSCSTPQTRISDHQDIYQSLSPRDQALVTQAQIRIGMSRTAVWLAWGSPDRKIVGDMGGGRTETWLYIYYATYPIRVTGRGTHISGLLCIDPFYYS